MGIIFYVPLLAWLVWCVYNGDIPNHRALIIASVVATLNLTIFLMKLSPPWYIVAYAATVLVLILHTYGGDVKIR